MTTLATLARQMSEQFHVAKRTDGSDYVCLRDGHPEWMTDVVHAAHGDMLPDDWRYRMISDAVSAIAETGDDASMDDLVEAADNGVSIYTHQLTDWLGSRADRIGYCDAAMEEMGGCSDITKAMQMGQYREREEVFSLTLDALAALVTEDEDAA